MSECKTSAKAHLLNRLEHPSNIFRNIREVTVLLDGRQDWREINVDLSVLEQMFGRPLKLLQEKNRKKLIQASYFLGFGICSTWWPTALALLFSIASRTGVKFTWQQDIMSIMWQFHQPGFQQKLKVFP